MTRHQYNNTEAQHRPTFSEPSPDLATLARLQGTAPVDFDELMATPERWPDDERVDDFIASVREWRTEGADRQLWSPVALQTSAAFAALVALGIRPQAVDYDSGE